MDEIDEGLKHLFYAFLKASPETQAVASRLLVEGPGICYRGESGSLR